MRCPSSSAAPANDAAPADATPRGQSRKETMVASAAHPVMAVTPLPVRVCWLKGFITDADLPKAEEEWPGLLAFLHALPEADRPPTFLELVWRFEAWRQTRLAA